MPKRKRFPIAPSDDWTQLRLLLTGEEQKTYELIRPVVLFGRSPALRARDTGVPERTIYRKAARFATRGMAGLFTESWYVVPR
jgi:hypothetical protein